MEIVAQPLRLAGLRVVLPNGTLLLDDLALDVRPGEVAVIMGGSGAGKSTLARVLFEPEALRRAGYEVELAKLSLPRTQLGLVPQRGALFDHVDVADNIRIGARYGGHGEVDVAAWLQQVGLDPLLAARGTDVGRLSGGQAQRVAVARALASQRRLLFLDEPSVGLDPHRVRMLARLIRAQVQALGLAVVVVTHDVALAAGVADQLYLLSVAERRLVPMFTGSWPGPMEADGIDDATRGAWLLRVEAALVEHLASHEAVALAPPVPSRKVRRRWLRHALAGSPFALAGYALMGLGRQLRQQPGDAVRIMRHVWRQALWRPLAFYAVVAALLGYTVLLVVSSVAGEGVRADAVIRQLGGAYAVALAPPLSALLFVAASGSAVNAWLGTLGLSKQTLALEALGIPQSRYLWGPTWLALGVAYLVIASVVVVAMLGGGYALCRQLGVPNAWALLSEDVVAPRPERVRFAIRGATLIWLYAWGLAANVIAYGAAAKHTADDVTQGMTRGVVRATLWVVALELATVLVLRHA